MDSGLALELKSRNFMGTHSGERGHPIPKPTTDVVSER